MPPTVTPDLLTTDLPDLVRRVLGSRTEISTVNISNQRYDYLVAEIDLHRPHQRVVIKLAGREAAEAYAFDRTAAVFDLVRRHTDLHMPQVYALDVSCQQHPWRWMLREYLSGEELAALRPHLTPDELSFAFQQIGRAVAQLHTIPFPAFGSLAVSGSLTQPLNLQDALCQRARRFIPDDDFYHFFARTLQDRLTWFDPPDTPGLVHEDLHAHNLIFSPGPRGPQLVTILDFDKAWAGPPESDLARLDLWTGMSPPSFWQAYTAERPLAPGFSQRKLLYQLLWCLEFARPTPKHIKDTAAVCQALGVRLPKIFPQPM